jgi:hypothetical protein
MRHILLALVVCLGLTGCDIDPVYAQNTGTVEFCDDYGCRYVASQTYYDTNGTLFYWDANFGCWISNRGYWLGGVYYPGFYPGYHNYYHSGWYHGWHGGGHYYHGGGGHGGWHGGGHGGHR